MEGVKPDRHTGGQWTAQNVKKASGFGWCLEEVLQINKRGKLEMKKLHVVGLSIVLTGLFNQIHAQSVPELFNFQGAIANIPEVEPDSEVEMEIRLWDSQAEGEVVWGPQVFDGVVETGHGAKVKLVNGRFNLIIGPEDIAGRKLSDAFGVDEVFLSLIVEGSVMEGRQRVLSTPYSIRASFAETAGNAVAAEGLKGRDGEVYGWEVLFEGGTPSNKSLASDFRELVALSSNQQLLVDIYKQHLEEHEWPLFDTQKQMNYRNKLDRLKGLLGPEWMNQEYEELRRRSNLEKDNLVVDSGLLSKEAAIRMIWVGPGEFQMGSPASELERFSREGPTTQVNLTQGFWLGQTEITQLQWETIMGTSVVDLSQAYPEPVPGEGSVYPIVFPSWDEAMAFCAKLNDRESAAGRLPEGFIYSLPTEAQWEYACRAGTTTRFSFGDDISQISIVNYAWYTENTDMLGFVGTQAPNPWGFYDMHGNVFEWCLDWLDSNYLGGQVADPLGPTTGIARVARGGSWLNPAAECRSAYRGSGDPSRGYSAIGFRLALVSGSID